MYRDLNGVRYAVHTAGAGDTPVVLLHYFGGSGQTWQRVLHLLDDQAQIVAPDLRGFGDTEAPASGYAVADYAADILALLETVQAERIILAGHSMGGKFALAVAARRPERLAALVLVAPSPPTPEPMTDADRERLLRSHGDASAAAAQIRTITQRPLPPELIARTAADHARSSRAAWEAWLRHGSRENIAEQVRRINVPIEILAGADDPVIGADVLQRELLPYLQTSRIRYTVVPEAGHLLPLEAPTAVAPAIQRHLS